MKNMGWLVLVIGVVTAISLSGCSTSSSTSKGSKYSVPKTGQANCFDAAGSIISCTTPSAAGQDGALQLGIDWPNPRFTVGTGLEFDCVTDNLTGLMWAKDADLLPTGPVDWQSALDFVAAITNGGSGLCGHTDWRLPNRTELRSLIDFSQPAPPLPVGHPFINVQFQSGQYYWTSSTYALDPTQAWDIRLDNGAVGDDSKTSLNYVWPVRSGQ